MRKRPLRRFEVSFEPSPEIVPVARALVREVVGVSASPDAADDCVLVLSELLANAVRHGRIEPGRTISVRVGMTDDTVRLEIEHPGASQAFAVDIGQGLRSSGFGLRIVHGIAARWGASLDEHTTVWAEIPLAADGHAPRAG